MKELFYIIASYMMLSYLNLNSVIITIIILLVVVFDYSLKVKEKNQMAEIEAFKLYMGRK